MSDEQTRLLQQILDVQTEYLAFAKQQGAEFKAMQQTALAGQTKSLRMSRFVILVMVVAFALLITGAILNSTSEEASKPEAAPARDVQK